ncbi:hypothetical protein GE09DRAFT_1109726 [Coniochaeta sp. 2T2.1]|nr:hypothetical protein GE09DRAFT_1109726 [Coniochaeta sp. 2T2.1]
MNFQNLNFDYVEEPRPYPQHVAESRLPRTPSNHSESTLRPLVNDHDSADIDHASFGPASPSPPTVIPYVPSPDSPSTSTSELYGPDRHQLFGPPITVPNPNYQSPRLPPLPRTAVANLIPHHAMDHSADLQGRMNADMLTGFRDDLVREAGVVTPGVDDTPYIQFAIESLTKDRDTGYSGNDSLSSDETLGGHRAIPDQGLGYYQPPPSSQQHRPIHREAPQIFVPPPSGCLAQNLESEILDPGTVKAPSDQPQAGSKFDFDFDFPPRPEPQSPWIKASLLTRTIKPTDELDDENRTIDEEKKTSDYLTLYYKPWLLRPASFITLLLLCSLMVAALIFSAIHSSSHNGLVGYSHSGGQYFLFRILPQLLAAVILVYTQCVVATMFRILPFVRLASDNEAKRKKAIFLDLFPRSTLWPQLIDEWEMWMFVFVSWLVNLTLPLQSSLFTPIIVDEIWRWGAVQGVAWTLVALYVILIVSTIVTLVQWMRITITGLMWNPRSLADIAVMLSDSNIASQYKGTELASHRSTIGFALRHRNIEQLAIWRIYEGAFYAIRTKPSDDPKGRPAFTTEKTSAAHRSGGSGSDYAYDIEATSHRQSVRRAHLPWHLRNNQLIFSVVAATILLVALFVVSFTPSTRITEDGFLPGLASHPTAGGFSPANFLYTFLPSLLGLLLYLAFQSLDLSFRVLQPWAALADPHPAGTPARQSLLADYASCLPLQSTLHAVRNGHYRVAFLSLLSTLLIFLPILGGGIFLALTAPATKVVRMYPSLPVFAIILALLILYLLGLIACLPYRHNFRLPHSVTCLAEIIGFLVNEDLLREKCFKNVRSREEMLVKMGMGKPGDGGNWTFGDGGDGMLGVRRVVRYTEKRRVRKSQIRRGGRYGPAPVRG